MNLVILCLYAAGSLCFLTGTVLAIIKELTQ